MGMTNEMWVLTTNIVLRVCALPFWCEQRTMHIDSTLKIAFEQYMNAACEK